MTWWEDAARGEAEHALADADRHPEQDGPSRSELIEDVWGDGYQLEDGAA